MWQNAKIPNINNPKPPYSRPPPLTHWFSIGTPSILFLLYFGLFIYGIFAFCLICILSHLYFVTFALCLICILSYLHLVRFAFCFICILSYLHFGLFPIYGFSAPLPPSSKLPETCDWSSMLPETCDWSILCTGRCFWNSIDTLFRATSHDVVRHRSVCLPRTGLSSNTIYDGQLMSQVRVGRSCSISCS